MDMLTAIQERRSIRKFMNKPVDAQIMLKLIRLSRLYPSAGNRQSIRFGVIAGEQRNEVFHCLKWAAYLPDFEILPSQRPAAYIFLLTREGVDRFVPFEAGAAAATLMLAAQAYGLSTCCLGIADDNKVRKILNLPHPYEPIVTIAIGYGEQHGYVTEYQNSCRYYLDDNGNICVPKIDADKLIICSDLDTILMDQAEQSESCDYAGEGAI